MNQSLPKGAASANYRYGPTGQSSGASSYVLVIAFLKAMALLLDYAGSASIRIRRSMYGASLILMGFSFFNLSAQNYGVANGSNPLAQNSFVKGTVFPTSTSTSLSLQIGLNYLAKRERAILYGGNLGVSQTNNNYFDYLGQWSLKGKWTRFNGNSNFVPVNIQILKYPGLNYLVDYHRWGDYSAHFGLRERATDIGVYVQEQGGPPIVIPPNPDGEIKDAVITWSYEHTRTPSRLIFESIDGTDPAYYGSSNGAAHDVSEKATILFNGNFGLGTPAPTAHFHLKPDVTNSSADPILVQSSTGYAQFNLKSNGNLGIGVVPTSTLDIQQSTGNSSSNFLSMKDVNGNSRFEIKNNGNVGIGVSPTSVLDIKQSSSNSSSDFLSINDAGSNSKLILKNNGNVGIDVANPTSKLDVNGNISVVGLTPNRIIGNTNYFEGLNTLKSPIASLGTDKTLLIKDKTNADLMYVQDNGELYLKSQSYPITGNPDKALYIAPDGKVYPANTVSNINLNQFWNVGGNSFVGGLGYKLGTISNNSIDLMAGNYNFGYIHGFGGTSDKGQLSLRNSVAIGSDPMNSVMPGPDGDYALKLYSTINPSTCTKPNCTTNSDFRGILKCQGFGPSISNVLEVGNQAVNMLDYRYYFGEFGATLNNPLAVNGTVYPVDDITYDLGINATNRWNDLFILNTPTVGSDRNLKKNITDLQYGLSDIMKLRPVTYEWKKKSNGTRIGFIAQEVEQIFPEVVTKDSSGENYGMKYTEIIPILTKGIQEQQAVIDTLKQQITLLIAGNKTKENLEGMHQREVLNQQPLLFQNNPNPFNGVTFIDYFLPPDASNAFIRVIDNTGRLIKAFPLKSTGYGQVELDCTNIAAGSYHYSLLVNSQLIDTKTMIVAGNN